MARSQEFLDPKMLLHRFEEKFDFPPRLVEFADRLSSEVKSVGQEHQPLARVRVTVTDTPERALIVRTFYGFQADRLVRAETSCPVMLMTLQDGVLTVGFHPGHEPDAALVEVVQPGVVDVGSIENDGRARIEVKVLAGRSQVMVLTAPFAFRNTAQGESARQSSIVVESSAST